MFCIIERRSQTEISVLEVGKGSNSGNYDHDWETGGKKGKRKVKAADKPKLKAQDHQILHKAVLSSFKKCCDGGGVRCLYNGKQVLWVPFLLTALSDAKEYSAMTGSYASFGNSNSNCLMKSCKCLFHLLSSSSPKCEPITMRDLDRCQTDADYAKSISQHQVVLSWNKLPMTNLKSGICKITPYERLHVFGQGLYKDTIAMIHEIIGPGGTNKSDKDLIDMLFIQTSFDIRRNSERDIPRMSRRYCVSDGTRVTGDERRGNCFGLGMVMTTQRGSKALQQHCKKLRIGVADVVETIALLLAYERWIMSHMKKWELENAGPAVSHLMDMIKQNLPNELGNGWNKVKFHALYEMIDQLKSFGSGQNLDGGDGKRFHKDLISKAGDNTQKRPNLFMIQVARRNGDQTVVDTAFNYVKDACPTYSKRHTYDIDSKMKSEHLVGDVTDQDQLELVGKYTMHCSVPRGRLMEAEYKVDWHRINRRM